MIDLFRNLPHLLDFPMTIFLVWIGLKVWREAKELVVRIDERHHVALRDIADKTERALAKVTEGMASIREEVRVFRAEVYGRIRPELPPTRFHVGGGAAGESGDDEEEAA